MQRKERQTHSPLAENHQNPVKSPEPPGATFDAAACSSSFAPFGDWTRTSACTASEGSELGRTHFPLISSGARSLRRLGDRVLSASSAALASAAASVAGGINRLFAVGAGGGGGGGKVGVVAAAGLLALGLANAPALAQTTGSPDGNVSGQSTACGCLPNGGCPPGSYVPGPNTGCVCMCLTTGNSGTTSPPDAGPPIAPPGPDNSLRALRRASDPDSPFPDSVCNQPSLNFSLSMRRYIGPTHENTGDIKKDGTLQNIETLITNGVIGRQARITIVFRQYPSSGAANDCGTTNRVEKITLNGRDLAMTGSSSRLKANDDGTWTKVTFLLPVEWVKFPKEPGTWNTEDQTVLSAVVPRGNSITITFARGDCVCTQIDWASLEIRAMSPVILVHGIGGGPTTFTSFEMAQSLEDAKLIADRTIHQLPSHQTIEEDGGNLRRRVPLIARDLYGADLYHLVCHSKGGLDSRWFLQAMNGVGNSGPSPVSLITMGTPHMGSPVADFVYAFGEACKMYKVVALDTEFEVGTHSIAIAADQFLIKSGNPSLRPGWRDLRTGELDRQQPRNITVLRSMNNKMLFYAIGTSADIDGSNSISGEEERRGFTDLGATAETGISIASMFMFGPISSIILNEIVGTVLDTALDRIYQICGRYSAFEVLESGTRDVNGNSVTGGLLRGVRRWSGTQPNDLVVPQMSSSGINTPFVTEVCQNNRTFLSGGIGGDHSYLLRREISDIYVIPRLREADTLYGGMKPWP